MYLKCNHRRTLWRKRRLQKFPQSRAITDLTKTPKSRIFKDFAKGSPRENGQKSKPTWGAPKSPRRKSGYLKISMRLKCNHWTILEILQTGIKKKGPKKRPTWGAPKTTWRKLGYLISRMRLKCNYRNHFGANGASESATMIAHFWRFCKRGTNGKWQKE